MNEKKRILVADDDEDLLGMLEFSLQDRGYEVTTATNGAKAVSAASHGSFDLAILDVVMPDMDGYHVAQSLYDQMGDKAPKILIMSGRNLEEERRIAMVSGASDVLQKPFRMEKLFELVERILAS